ncbi:HU family DNA-binding protein, partial [Vibrio mediterranei]
MLSLKKADINKKEAQAALEAITQSIEEVLSQGEEVSLIGFGTFKV